MIKFPITKSENKAIRWLLSAINLDDPRRELHNIFSTVWNKTRYMICSDGKVAHFLPAPYSLQLTLEWDGEKYTDGHRDVVINPDSIKATSKEFKGAEIACQYPDILSVIPEKGEAVRIVTANPKQLAQALSGMEGRVEISIQYNGKCPKAIVIDETDIAGVRTGKFALVMPLRDWDCR